MKTLNERLTHEQRNILAKEAVKYPTLGKNITIALNKKSYLDLTVEEAVNITGALTKGLDDIINIFNN